MKTNIKQKMKRTGLGLALALALLMPAGAACQGMPVYDNINFISFAKQLIEAGKQTSNIIKTMKFLKKQKENIEKVSNAVKDLKAIKEIIKDNERMYQVMKNDLRDILNSPYIKPNEVARVNESFNSVLESSINTMDFIDQILSSDVLKMSDTDRAKIIKEKEVESKEMLSDMKLRTRRYRDIISFRKMQDKINNREINY